MELVTDLDAFATERWEVQESERRSLLRSAQIAASRYPAEGWYSAFVNRTALLLRRRFREETDRNTSPHLRAEVAAFTAALRDALEKTTQEPDPQALALNAAVALVNAALNAAAEAEGVEGAVKTWVAIRDDRTRASHRKAHRQQVPVGEAFTVGGVSVRYPRDPAAPIGEIAGCRCALAITTPDALSAAAADVDTADVGVFAVPAEDDPIWEISSEDPPHVTILWLGEHPESEVPRAEFLDDLRQEWGSTPAFTLAVTGTDSFGEDHDIPVLTLDPGPLEAFRQALLEHHEQLAQWEQEARTWDEWKPHLTLGSPESPPLSEQTPTTITFDRLAVFVGDERHFIELGAGDMDTEEIEVTEEASFEDELIPWHGTLAPEGKWSGDRRKFGLGAVSWDEVPLPLLYQDSTLEGHDGSVIVGRIDKIWRDEETNLIEADGVFIPSEFTDRAIMLMAERALRGVSVDADSAEAHLETADGITLNGDEEIPDDAGTAFDTIRIRAATLVSTPAFVEAQVRLGRREDTVAASAFVSESSWDGSPSRFTVEQYHRACIIHLHDGKPESKDDCKMPIREPGGELSRAGVHAAASRINQVDAPDEQIAKAKAALRSAYEELGEEAPEAIQATGEDILVAAATQARADIEEFVDVAPGRTEDGPGWLTHPVDTDRLRDYWVRGPGAAKIGWGMPGDFNRCRTLLAEYVKPQHLSGYCANRHYDALGVWPGRHRAESVTADAAPSVVLSSGSRALPPKAWFTDPGLVEPSPIVVTEDGHIFGHLAAWGTCHIGFDNVCITPPHSATDYSLFRTGVIQTEDGDVPVGQITMGTGHAPTKGKISARVAAAHYDNTGFAVADVAVGDDEHGIWLSGRVRSSATAEQIEHLRAAALSGDWRRGELVAALVVNVPGFPIPRLSLAASGEGQEALVAAGVVRPREEPLAGEDLETIVARALERYDNAKEGRRRAMQALANRRKIATIAEGRNH